MPAGEETTRSREHFFDKEPRIEAFLELFDHLPNAYLYVKDRGSRFVAVNKNLLTIYNATEASDLIGRSDRDFHPPALAEAYLAEDRRVFECGRKIANQVWLVPYIHGTPQWYVSTKTPVTDRERAIVGLAGVMHPIQRPEDQDGYFGALAPALRLIEKDFCAPLRMSDAAKSCGLSATAFNRRFRTLLRMTPSDYLLALRVNAARQMLTTTTQPLSKIAIDCGFTDQSHFTKRFRQATGTTPSVYRRGQTQTESPT